MKNALRVVSVVTLILVPAAFYAWPLIAIAYPLLLATIIMTVLASVQRRQYAWLWATVGVSGLGVIVPAVLGPIIQSAVNQSRMPCEAQHGSVACPQSAGQSLLVNGLQGLLLVGLLLIILLAVVYSFRMRDIQPAPTAPPRPA